MLHHSAGGAMQDDKRHRRTERGRQGDVVREGGKEGEAEEKRKRGREVRRHDAGGEERL